MGKRRSKKLTYRSCLSVCLLQVEATGLKPFTTYNYQFKICGTETASPVGRTKTAPTADDDVSEISLAVFSCSNYREYLRIPSRDTCD